MQMLTNNIDTMKAEIAAHIDADQVLQGTYWENGKGCFIGCLTHSNCAAKVTERFGLPGPLVKLCEHVFEGLSAADSVTFFKDVGEAIGADGKDLSRVHWAFLRDTLKALPKQNNNIQKVIDPVIDGMELLARGQHWFAAYAAARAARATYAAARAARAARADAADAAADVAYAADAAYAAAYAAARAADAGYAAAYAARAASYAADVAYADAVDAARADAVDAGYAARAAEIKRQSESILALLAAIPQQNQPL